MKTLIGLLVMCMSLLVVACDSGPTEAEIQERVDKAVTAAIPTPTPKPTPTPEPTPKFTPTPTPTLAATHEEGQPEPTPIPPTTAMPTPTPIPAASSPPTPTLTAQAIIDKSKMVMYQLNEYRFKEEQIFKTSNVEIKVVDQGNFQSRDKTEGFTEILNETIAYITIGTTCYAELEKYGEKKWIQNECVYPGLYMEFISTKDTLMDLGINATPELIARKEGRPAAYFIDNGGSADLSSIEDTDFYKDIFLDDEWVVGMPQRFRIRYWINATNFRLMDLVLSFHIPAESVTNHTDSIVKEGDSVDVALVMAFRPLTERISEIKPPSIATAPPKPVPTSTSTPPGFPMTAAQFLESHTSLLEGRAGLVKFTIDQPNAEKVLVNVAPVYPIDGRVLSAQVITCAAAKSALDYCDSFKSCDSSLNLWIEVVNATSSGIMSMARFEQTAAASGVIYWNSLMTEIPSFGAIANDNHPSPCHVQIIDHNWNCINAYRFEYNVVD